MTHFKCNCTNLLWLWTVYYRLPELNCVSTQHSREWHGNEKNFHSRPVILWKFPLPSRYRVKISAPVPLPCKNFHYRTATVQNANGYSMALRSEHLRPILLFLLLPRLMSHFTVGTSVFLLCNYCGFMASLTTAAGGSRKIIARLSTSLTTGAAACNSSGKRHLWAGVVYFLQFVDPRKLVS